MIFFRRTTMKGRFGFAAMVTLALAGAACVGGQKGVTAEDKERLKAYILDSAPADMTKTDINFENKVHIVGYKFSPAVAKPGDEVTMTYYWRCDEPVEDGWRLFTHIHDPVSDKLDNLDNVGPIREEKANKHILGPDRWERGKYYVDEQKYKVPDWMKGPEFEVMIGIWKGDARLRIVSGPTDGDNRAIVGKVRTGLAEPEPVKKTQRDVPEITVTKLAKGDTIVVDGKGDDKGWGGAASTGPFVDVGTGQPNSSFPVNGTAKVAWDDQAMYVLFDVKDPDIVGGFTDKSQGDDRWTAGGQPKLWTKDTVEIMIDPDGDGDAKDYYEIQVNPQNKLFKSQFDTKQQPMGGPNGPFGHEDWEPKIKSAVVVRGTVDKKDDKDDGYSVEIAVPWAGLAKAKQVPPKHGDTWRMNFYAMKDNGGPSWSPILGQGNFHTAHRFGRVTWVEAGKPLPGEASDAGAASDGGARGDAGAAARGEAGAAAAATDAGALGARPDGSPFIFRLGHPGPRPAPTAP
jgi:hypothetical protein